MSDHVMALGPLGVDPANFGLVCLSLLLLFVLYNLLPRGLRVQHFGAYPKRYAWSSRTLAVRDRVRMGGDAASIVGGRFGGGGGGDGASIGISTIDGGSSVVTGATGNTGPMGGPMINQTHRQLAAQGIGIAGASAYSGSGSSLQQRRSVGTSGRGGYASSQQQSGGSGGGTAPVFDASSARGRGSLVDGVAPSEEIVISAAMQQLRDPGVLVVAHGSKGKPKTVRLRLVESAISWRTESQRKKPSASGETGPKLGKLHRVPLAHIMYVDVGKQTTALRRVENASVSEAICFSLLTKEGSLDLECNSARERDALVSCFSLVLDEVHASNWRDVHRAPSSDMPSSFDGGDDDVGMREEV